MNALKNPTNIQELLLCLSEKNENVFLVSGGTDLAVEFHQKRITKFDLINLTQMVEWRKIEETQNEIIIGSVVTMTEIENNSTIKQWIPALSQSCSQIGSTQIRNRASIGGNIIHSSQCADTLPVLFNYDCLCELLNSKGEVRRLPIKDFILGIGKNLLANDEVLTRIIIKKEKSLSVFKKLGDRQAVTISKLNCCLKIELNANQTIKECHIYLGSIGVKPLRAMHIENHLQGQILTEEVSEDLKNVIQLEIDEAIPNRLSRIYKRKGAIGLIEDCLKQLFKEVYHG